MEDKREQKFGFMKDFGCSLVALLLCLIVWAVIIVDGRDKTQPLFSHPGWIIFFLVALLTLCATGTFLHVLENLLRDALPSKEKIEGFPLSV